MKNYYILLAVLLVVVALALISHLTIASNKNKAADSNNSNSVFTAEKFCIAKAKIIITGMRPMNWL